nr:hypothetical protein [Tanacetum cinerariifolium]
MPVQCPSKIKQHKSLDVTISIPRSIMMIRNSNVPSWLPSSPRLPTVLPSLSALSESGSHVTAAVSGSMYSATVAVSSVSEAGTPVHTLAHGGSEAHGVLSGLTLPNEPKPFGQHRPPPP